MSKNSQEGKTSESTGADAEYSFKLEDACPLSKSKIWSLLEDYYKRSSISAWDEIPFYPTSNTFIAETYADIVLAFLEDIENTLDYKQPLYILEMAAGTGCFSYYLLCELKKRIAYFSKLRRLQLCYIMADFTDSNPRNWVESPKLKPFVDDGCLKFAVFGPQKDRFIYEYKNTGNASSTEKQPLQRALLEPGKLANPLIAIANYFFDSIYQDAFQVENGKLKEVRFQFMSKSDPASWDSARFEDMKADESYHDCAENYYEDKRLNAVLDSYQKELKQASIIFPLGGFQCIGNLLEISDNNLLLISSDKGFTSKNYMFGLRRQPFIAHHGVFSYSVNYDAVRRYFEILGGQSFNTGDDNLSISTACNYLLKDRDCKLEKSRFHFSEKVDRQNMSNYLYFLQDLLTEVEPKRSRELARACIGYIQLCNYDPIVFCLCAPRIYFTLDEIRQNQAQLSMLLEILRKVKENFFSVQQQYDVFYWIGRIYYGLGMIDDALKSFAESLLAFGESSSTLYYIAACYELKKELESALRYYKDTLKIEPDCQYTRAGILRVEALLAQ